MHCEELTDDVLLDVAERRATSPALESVEFHLGQCRPCADRFLETAHIAKLAGLALKETPTRDLDARILEELDERIGLLPARGRRWLAPALAAAASSAFSLLATFVVLSSQPEPMKYAQLFVGPEEGIPAQAPKAPPAQAKVEPIRVEIEECADAPRPAPSPSVPIATVQIAPLIPDLNGDQRIDVADIMILMETLNEESPIALYDLNGDKKVDVADKMLLLHLDPK